MDQLYPKQSQLLPYEAFSHVFEPLRGKRIGLVTPIGNVGDQLITWATAQLLEHFGVTWEFWHQDTWQDFDFDELVFGGGGNMGDRYMNNWRLRDEVFHCGLPVTILPQTFTSPEPRPYKAVYVREKQSLNFCPEAILAPELALGLNVWDIPAPTLGVGIFLRRDQERLGARKWLFVDPVKLCNTPRKYVELASQYESIITDRLHFAICGLIAKRKVILVANDYHKNRSMYETWLHEFGCRFAENSRAAYKMIGYTEKPFWLYRTLLNL